MVRVDSLGTQSPTLQTGHAWTRTTGKIMELSQAELELGFWPARQLGGLIPTAIKSPDEFAGGDSLNIACTQSGLTPTRQRALVREWCKLLPELRVRTLVFSSKVSQDLFESACAVPDLEHLSVKWSSIRSMEAVSGATTLSALFLGSSPSTESLTPLSRVTTLKHLFVQGVPDPVDLSMVESLGSLREFGLSAGRGRRIKVQTLAPVGSLQHLRMLWLVSVQLLNDGLLPLHSLQNLTSLRTTISEKSKDFQALCAAVPTLKHFRRVG